jgi:DNA-binding IclR family transcriptional regulator
MAMTARLVAERTLQVLGLFTLEKPVWNAEEIALAIGVATSSAYRLLGALTAAGLVEAEATGRFVLGSAIVQLDRQIRLTDPLLQAARPIMSELVGFAPLGSTILLCRAFRDSVLCVHQVTSGDPSPVSYERGRPRPLFHGATSKIILAYTAPRILRRFHASHAEEIGRAGLGEDWSTFTKNLKLIRKTGVMVTRGEVDPGRCGIAAAVLNSDRKALGSISYVLTESEAKPRLVSRLSTLIQSAAREIEAAMAGNGGAVPVSVVFEDHALA